MAKTNGENGEEEVYQMIKSIKARSLLKLNEMYKKFSARLHLEESLPQNQRSVDLAMLRPFLAMLDKLIKYGCISKNNSQPVLMETVDIKVTEIKDCLKIFEQIVHKNYKKALKDVVDIEKMHIRDLLKIHQQIVEKTQKQIAEKNKKGQSSKTK